MADIKQISTIVNSVARQALGTETVTSTDATFVSIGKLVLSSDTNKDAWYKTLIDRIGRTVLSVRDYKGVNAELKREPIEYGAILQKISFKMLSASDNTSWNGQDTAASNPFAKHSTTVRQAFFDKWSVFEYDNTIPDIQLETAFTNESAMLAFIDGLFMSAYNALEMAYENTSNIARASLIAGSMLHGGATAINLLHEYNTLTNRELTVATCISDTEFLKYATRYIKLVSDRMQVMSTTFNAEEWERFTTKDLQVINVLADFSSAVSTYLQSDTYHKELVSLPLYKEVPYWQGSGSDWSFDNTSAIDVVLPEDNTEHKYTGVIATIYDRDAIGVTVDKRRTRSIYNPKDEFTNYFIKAEIGYYRDMTENAVVFYIAEV